MAHAEGLVANKDKPAEKKKDTAAETKSYFEDSELDDDELDAAAGGKGGSDINCNNGVGNITVDVK